MDALGIDFFVASMRIASPLFFAALGGIISERAGVFAVGLEGMMLAGALGATMGTFLTGLPVVGIMASVVCGMLIASAVVIVAVRHGADQMVTGLAVNILALGLTSFLLRISATGGRAPVIQVPLLPVWPIPFLSDIPWIGPVLFAQPPLTYLALLAVIPTLLLLLFRTQGGLKLRAAGENPLALFAAGTNPVCVRSLAVLASGAIAGLSGAVLCLQQVGTFTDGMTAGRGYLALAAIIVGRWMPIGALVACLLFGAAEAIQLRAQAVALPVSSYTIQMLPYVIALVVLAVLGRSASLPAAIGMAFEVPRKRG
jgi:simple sugar transport system permease protein